MIKAVAGGGGRGMRARVRGGRRSRRRTRAAAPRRSGVRQRRRVRRAAACRARATSRCRSRAIARAPSATSGSATAASSAGARSWSRSRPRPGSRPRLRARLLDAAVALAARGPLDNVATFEFLVDADGGEGAAFAFLEVNPRLQVEHTVTEEMTGLDLVRLQLDLASGATLADLGLAADDVPEPRGIAMQVRINMETMAADGSTRPGRRHARPRSSRRRARASASTRWATRATARARASTRSWPSSSSASRSGRLDDVAAKAYRALCEFRIAGVPTNIPFLQSLLRHPDVARRPAPRPRFVEDHVRDLASGGWGAPAALLRAVGRGAAARRARGPGRPAGGAGARQEPSAAGAPTPAGSAERVREPAPAAIAAPDNTVPIAAPMQGTVVSVAVGVGDVVREGQRAPRHGRDEDGARDPGEGRRRRARDRGRAAATRCPRAIRSCSSRRWRSRGASASAAETVDLDAVRPDLAEVLARQAKTRDAARPEAVARRRKTGQRTVRENIDDLCDAGSFVEYGSLVMAARRQRNTVQELIDTTPADGLVMGVGRVNGASVRRREVALRRHVVRLHRARRHAGQEEPPEEGPHVRARRAGAAADRVLH